MNLRLTSSAIALVAMTAPAFADVTPEQVWQSWVDYYKAAGYEITEGSRQQAGDTLTLNDVSATGGMPESKVEFTLGTVTLTDMGDGKVRTVFSDRITGNASGVDPDDMTYAVPFVIDMPGNATVTSGAPEDMTHEFDYPTIDVALSTVKSDDKETPLPIRFSVVGSTGTMRIVAGAPAKYDYAMKSERMTVTGDIASEEGENVKFDANLAALEITGNMVIPENSDFGNDMNAAVKAGLDMNGMMKSGPIAMKFDFAGKGEDGQTQTGNGSYDGKGFDLTFAMSQDGLIYQGGSDAFTTEFSGGQIPFPIKYAADSASFDLQFPVMKRDEAQPFKLAYSLAGLTIGDELWGLFDPEAKLPRDPASLDLDLTGLANINQDLLDPAAMMPETPAATDGEPGTTMPEAQPEPFLPVEVNINQFALSLLGASATANGRLTGPEGGDLTQIPVGELHATFEGVNGLLDTLGSMGLIPDDQLMGARMMLTMFAKPSSEGEDKLTTDLEFKEDGSLFANGQKLR